MSVSLNAVRSRINADRDISQSTLDSYMRNLRIFLTKYLKVNVDKRFPLKIFYDCKNIKRHLDTIRLSTRRNYIISIMALLKVYKSSAIKKIIVTASDGSKEKITVMDCYLKYLRTLNLIVDRNYQKQERTQKEKDNWMSMDDLETFRNSLGNSVSINFDALKDMTPSQRNRYVDHTLKMRQVDTIQRHLVLSLYTMLPPQRNDYACMQIVRTSGQAVPPKGNYLDIPNKKFYIREFKSAKYREKQKELYPEYNPDNPNIVLDIPPPLLKTVEDWLLINQGPYFLINVKSGTPMSKNGLTQYLNKIFAPRKISTSMLRKIYLSYKFPVTYNRAELEKVAHDMGHTADVSSVIYRKKLP